MSVARLFLVTMAMLVVVGCSTEPAARILFIGNSYTTSNDLPGMVRDMARSAGHTVEVEARAPGGWWLRDHAASGDTLGAIAGGDFDFVVLQEQSMVPADRRLAERESVPAVRSIGTRVNQSGARVVLFMTWGHRGGSSEVGHRSYDTMQVAIADTYDRLGEVVASEVAPVGAAWWLARAERPDILLYQPDGNHPSASGTYLAAAVLTAHLLDVDPTEFDVDLELPSEHASTLRGLASRAVGGEIPWR